MNAVFEKALEITFGFEGGFSDRPGSEDKGGRTNYGITQATLNLYRKRVDATFPADVKDITKEQAKAIYRDFFWVAAHCDALPPAIAVAVFDYAVNSGPERAITRLQEALRVEPDGKFGNVTQNAVEKCDPRDALGRLMRIRFIKWIEDSTFEANKNGWFERGVKLCLDLGAMIEVEK